MIKIIILSFFIFSTVDSFAQKTIPLNKKPEVSLTLIPPSPVTDQIILDIRAGVRNDGKGIKTFKVFFYLDDEKKSFSFKTIHNFS